MFIVNICCPVCGVINLGINRNQAIFLHNQKSSQKCRYTLFFISNTFISNARLKLATNQEKAKQYPEDELLLFENYSLSSSRHHSKIIGDILKNVQKTSASV